MKLVPFDNGSALPAYLSGADFLDINKEVVRAQGFPTLSIKGMKFTITKDGVKKVVTKPDDEDEVAQSLGLVFLRANMNAKTFYAAKYSESDSAGARPDCYSQDGVAPSANSLNPQSKKCAICPQNQWGSRTDDNGNAKEGKSCQDNARIAVSAPDKLDPMLLRVPPASLKPLREMLKIVAARKVPYNAVVIKVGFDREAPSPKLTFKPVGLVDDAGYAGVREMYDDELVRGIVGLDDFGMEALPTPSAPRIDADELDAALAAREVTRKAAAPTAKAKPVSAADLDLDDEPAPTPKPKAKPVVVEDGEEDVPAPKAKAKAKPVAVEDDEEDAPAPKAAAPKAKSSGASDLLADLDDLLGNKDD